MENTCSSLLDRPMSDNVLHYRKTCLGQCSVPGRLYHREKYSNPLLPVHAFICVFYTETLNCSELFAAIKLFGVINKSFNFV